MSADRNDQVALVALLRHDVAGNAVDTEDVALTADELAPGRFRWRKYPQHIDLGLVRNALQDARKRGLVDGGALKGWTLSPSGRAQALALTGGGERARQDRLSVEDKRWQTRERARLLAEPMIARVATDGLGDVSERDLLKLFRLDDYVVGEPRRARIAQFVRVLGHDAALGPILRAIEERLTHV